MEECYFFALPCNFTKSNTPPWVISRFLNCTNASKSRKASHNLLGYHWEKKSTTQ